MGQRGGDKSTGTQGEEDGGEGVGQEKEGGGSGAVRPRPGQALRYKGERGGAAHSSSAAWLGAAARSGPGPGGSCRPPSASTAAG